MHNTDISFVFICTQHSVYYTLHAIILTSILLKHIAKQRASDKFSIDFW